MIIGNQVRCRNNGLAHAVLAWTMCRRARTHLATSSWTPIGAFMITSDTRPRQPLRGLAQLRDAFERGKILGQEAGRLQERHSLSKSSTWPWPGIILCRPPRNK